MNYMQNMYELTWYLVYKYEYDTLRSCVSRDVIQLKLSTCLKSEIMPIADILNNNNSIQFNSIQFINMLT
jgi:hypothetical protein